MFRSVSILIPTHNRADLLRQTLSSLSALHYPPSLEVDILVVANACTDSTVDVCRHEFARLPIESRCVDEPQPGLSVARNRAVVESTGEICAFLDDDVLVSPDWLAAMVEVYNTHPADLVGGKIELWWSAVERPPWMTLQLEGYLSRLDHGDQVTELLAPKGIVGANFSFRRAIFAATGPFRADLGRVGSELLSGEETDFCDRARQQGARVFFAPKMQLKHWVAPQRAQVAYLTRVARGWTTSRIRSKKHFGPKQFLRSFLGNIYLVVWREVSRWFAKLRGDSTGEITARILRASAAAGVAESLRRVFRGNKTGVCA
jgi:glycosyltransferase involved in cell wall biosynthesis